MSTVSQETRPQRPPLERFPVQLQDHPERGPALPERPLRDDRARGGGPPVAARLQLRERQLRRAPRVLQHQGAGRPAHLPPAAHSPRQSDPRRPQADRDADPRSPAAGKAALPPGQRNRPRALHEPGPRSGGVRALRAWWSSPTASATSAISATATTSRTSFPNHELVGEDVKQKLRYYPTVTREAFRNQGRITELLGSDKLPADLGLPALDPAHNRVMICGSPAMLADTVALLEARGFEEGSSDGAGHYVIERAFVQK